MANLVVLASWMVSAYYASIGRTRTSRGFAAFSLATTVIAFSSGFILAAREDARRRDGVVSTAIVGEKLSTTGEDGTQTFDPWPGGEADCGLGAVDRADRREDRSPDAPEDR